MPTSLPIVPPRLVDAGRLATWTRQAKVSALQAGRLARWLHAPREWSRPHRAASAQAFRHVVYERTLPIARLDAAADPFFEAGKQANLSLAAPLFDGLVIDADHPLSYWRVLGRVTEAAGYRYGMELRGGCIVPAIGGGLCLLSNALFEMAARLGWRVLERHGHTLEAIPPRPGELWGLDATVFWPYVDLRLAPTSGPTLLGVRIDGAGLHLSARAATPAVTRSEFESIDEALVTTSTGVIRRNRIRRRTFDIASGTLLSTETIAENERRLLATVEQRRSCLSCGETSCHSRVTIPVRR